MGDKDDWMRNPYMFPGVPSITPIHIKRRSESHNTSRNTSNHTHNYNTGYGGGSNAGGPLSGIGGGSSSGLSSNPGIGGGNNGGSGKRPSTTSSLLRPSTASGASSTGAATTPTHISTTFGSSQNTGSGGSYGPSTSFSHTSPLQRMPTNVSNANVPTGSSGSSGGGALNVFNNMSRTSITGSDAYSIHYDIGTGTSTPNSSSSGVNTIMDNGLGGNIRHPYTVLKRGKKHHAFSSEVVPYPLNYEARILDCDSMDITSSPFPSLAYSPSYSSSTSAASSASSLFYTAPTSQDPPQPSSSVRAPKRVLDVGCGNGAWILNAAGIWKETSFVGLDLVAIQPDLYALDRLKSTVERQKERMHNAKQMKRSDGSLARSMESGGSGGGGHVSAGRRSFSRFESAPPNLGNDMMRSGEKRRPSTANTTSTTATIVAPNQTIYQQSRSNPQTSSSDLRIRWVHHNFLTRRLPFKDEEFDFIRVKGIAQGVPEDKWDYLLTSLSRVLCPGGIIEIIEEDILFPTILAPKVTFGQVAGVKGPGVNGTVAANPRRTAKVHQNQLKATNLNAQQALHKQALIYSEETRPTAFLSPSSPLGMQDSDDSPTRSPLTPVDNPMPSPRDASFGLVAIPGGGGSSGGSGFYGIPASYLQYAQTVPALARSLPPLALVNPFLHQAGKGQGPDDQTKPFSHDHTVLQTLYMAVWQRRWINLQPTKVIGGVLGMQTELGAIVASECLEIAKPNLSGAVGPIATYPRRPTTGRRPSGTQAGGEGGREEENAEAIRPDDTSSTRRRGSGGSRTLLDDETVIRRRSNSVSSSSSAFSLDESDSESESDVALDSDSTSSAGEDVEEKEEGGKDTTASAAVPRRPADEEENFMILESSSDEDENEERGASMISPPLTPRPTSPAEAEKSLAQPSASTSASVTASAATGGAAIKDRKTKMKNAMSRAKKPAPKSKQGSGKTRSTSTQGKDSVATGKAKASTKTYSSSEQKTLKKQESRAKKGGLNVKKSTRKYPILSLTSALHDMFPGSNSEITKTIHLMHAWENVVACKEAMWEEFLQDSARRDREAGNSSASSGPPGSSPAGSSGSLLGGLGSLGGVSGLSSMGAIPGFSGIHASYPGGAGGYGPRRAPTLLDELEWADSDTRRSERERFDILLDRYEMRIKRYCARIYETTSIPCLIARDRHAFDEWASDSEEEYEHLDNVDTPTSRAHDTSRNPRGRQDEGDGHTSADEMTLAEPNSPHSASSSSAAKPSILAHLPPGSSSSAAPPIVLNSPSTSTSHPPPPSHPPTTSSKSKFRLGTSGLRLNTSSSSVQSHSSSTQSHSSTVNPRARARTLSAATSSALPSGSNVTAPLPTSGNVMNDAARKGKSREGIDKAEEEDVQVLPSRIIRAFIATKIHPTALP
ncbi:hypothetical protein CPB86DRAFT_118716 [Serendipita vermifera]|nr:hypothetical protein CPB86DRAFT_118716 [Serendipita vermifera]